MFWRVFLNFLCPFLLSHLLINYQISSSKNWPANRKRDFLSESANRIPKTFVATPSIELKKRIHIVSISRHNPFGKHDTWHSSDLNLSKLNLHQKLKLLSLPIKAVLNCLWVSLWIERVSCYLQCDRHYRFSFKKYFCPIIALFKIFF